ncbi:hypothetical protein K501DRAFT_65226 [Backusella circina FSU 941]|nr:hypothetical protein K501DRAFT_65226 [Backusella circina FSU 941]
MEEEWNLVENDQNETPSVEKSQSTSLTLNFNRFEQLEEERQQLLQDEPLSPIPQHYLEEQEEVSSPVNSHSSDGSNWMNNMALFDNNDTTTTDIENELDFETPPSSFLFSNHIAMTSQAEQQDKSDLTRESVADQDTKWTSSLGSSVPYLSELPPPSSKKKDIPETVKSIAPFSFSRNGPLKEQLASISAAAAVVEPESEDILPATKKWKPNPRPRLTEHTLEPFINSSSISDDDKENGTTGDDDNDEGDATSSQANNERLSPRERMNNCMRFSQDQDQSLARLFVDLEQKNPSLAWSKLSELDLRRQNLSALQDIKSCFPVLRRLRVSHNALTMITGLPATLNILEASSNRLTELNLDYPFFLIYTV